jgi:serine/threonine-protein kinase
MGEDTRTIGPYQVEGRLGAGGMGEVFRAYDERLDRKVAVKLIRREAAEDERARERFRREARTAASLSHPAIVQIHDLLTTSEGDALVMEFVTGVTLTRLFAGGPLPLDRVLRLGQEIAEGIAAAHARGIVHRDLKAENVMVTDGGHAKILDFGVAKRLRRSEDEATLSVAGAVVGTYSSMSPEQARGLAVDHRSDLFSFGSLLYEMACGRPPFLAATILDTLSNLCAARQLPVRSVRPEVPAPLSELIDRLLEKDPARRPQSADEVAATLARIAAATAGHAPYPEATAALATTAYAPSDLSAADDAPTVAEGRASRFAGAVESPSTPLDGRSGTPLPGPLPRRRRRRLLAGLAAAATVAAGAAFFLLRGNAAPLTVAVTKPAVGGSAGAGSELMAAGLRSAVLETLLALGGVSTVAPEQVDPVAGAPLAVARSVAADEVVTPRLDCSAAICRVALSRVSGKDGRLLWTESFEAPADEPYLLAGMVASHLRHGYAARRAREGAAGLEVRPEDYKEYLRLRGDAAAQRQRPGELLGRLAALEASSPRFLEGFVMEAGVRRLRFNERRDPADLDLAFAALARARRIAPGDPRPLAEQFEVATVGERHDRAEEALAELERLSPGEPGTLMLRARFLEPRDAKGALALMRKAVARRPSWLYLANLANMEYRLGEYDAARRDLHTLLARSPELYLGETLLAQVELISGNPQTAAELYTRLVARAPQLTELNNLGLAYLLLRRYPPAVARFRQALALAPANPSIALNLADATLLAGDRAGAAALYRRVLALAERDPAAASWQVQSVRAQALAHLGQRRQAVDAAQQVFLLAHDNAQAVEEVSLVYTLVGDQSLALSNVERALAAGVEPVWFGLPWFDPLRALPDFQDSLKRHAKPARA